MSNICVITTANGTELYNTKGELFAFFMKRSEANAYIQLINKNKKEMEAIVENQKLNERLSELADAGARLLHSISIAREMGLQEGMTGENVQNAWHRVSAAETTLEHLIEYPSS